MIISESSSIQIKDRTCFLYFQGPIQGTEFQESIHLLITQKKRKWSDCHAAMDPFFIRRSCWNDCLDDGRCRRSQLEIPKQTGLPALLPDHGGLQSVVYFLCHAHDQFHPGNLPFLVQGILHRSIHVARPVVCFRSSIHGIRQVAHRETNCAFNDYPRHNHAAFLA